MRGIFAELVFRSWMASTMATPFLESRGHRQLMDAYTAAGRGGRSLDAQAVRMEMTSAGGAL